MKTICAGVATMLFTASITVMADSSLPNWDDIYGFEDREGNYYYHYGDGEFFGPDGKYLYDDGSGYLVGPDGYYELDEDMGLYAPDGHYYYFQ